MPPRDHFFEAAIHQFTAAREQLGRQGQALHPQAPSHLSGLILLAEALKQFEERVEERLEKIEEALKLR